MKIQYSLLFIIICSVLLLSSCKKHVIQPVNQLSLLSPATQTGANTFGCLVNGQAFVPKNRSFSEGPVLQCNYIYTAGGYFLNVSGGNENNGIPVDIRIQTDSLAVSEGRTLTLTEFAPGMASGSYTFANSSNIFSLNTDHKQTGQLLITRLDSIKQIVSGTFFFNVLTATGDTIKVTDGRFDMHYTR